MGNPSMSAKRAAVLASAAVLALGAFMAPLPAAINPAPGAEGTSGAPGDESCLASRINSARRAAGVAPLAIHSGLISVGRRHSAEMVAAGYWYHSANLGSQLRPLGAVKWGENVGWATDCSYMDNFFMNSTVHRNNRLNPVFTHVGAGVVAAGDGKIWVTELFMRSGSAAPFQNPPPTLKGEASSPSPAASEPITPAPASSPKASRLKPAVKLPVVKAPQPKGKLAAYEQILQTEPGLTDSEFEFDLEEPAEDAVVFSLD